MYDAIIIGAGPAGLSAALILGRCRRRVLVFDTGKPRNRWARHAHGFLTRDGIAPGALLAHAREQLRPYTSVAIETAEVTYACPIDAETEIPAFNRGEDDLLENARRGGFEVTLADGRTFQSRKLLLATGTKDEFPGVEGFDRFYGASIHHCPYCDGWEHRDETIAVYGKEGSAVGLALELLQWSRDLVLCTDGPVDLPAHVTSRLDYLRIRVRPERVLRFEGDGSQVSRVVFESGPDEPCSAVFFNAPQHLQSDLALLLGCRVSDKGTILTGAFEATGTPGLFVAGDASRSVQFLIVAASEGAEAAVAINTALMKEDFGTP